MSHEIKFRAWDKGDKIMRPVFEIEWYGDPSGIDSLGFDEPTLYRGPEQYVLMQYTGLKDKNGVEIYEGDVLKDGTSSEGTPFIEVVSYEAPMFYRRNQYGWTGPLKRSQLTTEVIGNIYENPELVDAN